MFSLVISAAFLTVNVQSRITSIEQCIYSTTDGTCGGAERCIHDKCDDYGGSCSFYSCAGLPEAVPYTYECSYDGQNDIKYKCTEDATDPESCQDYDICTYLCQGLTCEDYCLTFAESFSDDEFEDCNAAGLGVCESYIGSNTSEIFWCVHDDDDDDDDGPDPPLVDDDINDDIEVECNYDLCTTTCTSFVDGTCEGPCTTVGLNLRDTDYGDCDNFFAAFPGFEEMGKCFNFGGAGVTLTCTFESSSASSDTGMIIGIVVGAVVLVCIIVAVVYRRFGKTL